MSKAIKFSFILVVIFFIGILAINIVKIKDTLTKRQAIVLDDEVDEKNFNSNNDEVVLTDAMIEDRLEEMRMEDSYHMTALNDLDELQKHLNFKLKYPGYIPNGYKFTRAQCMDYKKVESGAIDSYILEFQNMETTKFIFVDISRIEKEINLEEACLDMQNPKKDVVNGSYALSDNNSISWFNEDIRYKVWCDDLAEEEIKKIAESIKDI